MFLIIEGIHDVGKTTLINSICKKIHFHQFSCRRSIPQLSQSKNIDISNFALGANCSIVYFSQFSNILDIIFDRLHLSEFAYSQVMRNCSHKEAIKKFKAIDEKLAYPHVKLIYLSADIKIIIDRTKQRNKSFELEQTLALIHSLQEAFEESTIPKLALNTENSIDFLTNEVIKFIDADISPLL